jgi:hypothetical protein
VCWAFRRKERALRRVEREEWIREMDWRSLSVWKLRVVWRMSCVVVSCRRGADDERDVQ